MLNTPAEFPAAGSPAFLSPTGEAVRIQRRNDDGTILISREATGASGNITVTRKKLHQTQIDAVNAGLNAPGRRKAAAQ